MAWKYVLSSQSYHCTKLRETSATKTALETSSKCSIPFACSPKRAAYLEARLSGDPPFQPVSLDSAYSGSGLLSNQSDPLTSFLSHTEGIKTIGLDRQLPWTPLLTNPPPPHAPASSPRHSRFLTQGGTPTCSRGSGLTFNLSR